MSLQAILAKIENDAKIQAEEITRSACNEQKEALHRVKSRIKERHHRDTERIRNRIEANAKQMKSHARREMEKALLSHRRKIVDRVITDSVKKIASAADYLELIGVLIQSCDLQGEVEIIICANDKNRITENYLKKLSTDKRKFVLSDENHTDYGGILMRSGDISLNATLSMIAELNHDSMVMELSRLLPLEGQVD
ncbi:MAG: V-type ATP synthase subunit E [Candidatus Sabulitectum sp.]|nr:V-type ATP synthase subunit E [Candidatus Sabulitectum sp.]